MKLSLHWISDYVGSFSDDPKSIGLKMTLATAEIEGQENHGSDTLYDIDNKSLTHRPDLWGHYGFAREVAAVYKRPLQALNLGTWTAPNTASDPLQIDMQCDASACPRYNALVIDHIKVGPSPDWLVQRLESLGARSINNIVDLTNYVMYEVGQPMHAFDRHKLNGNRIVVRHAQAGESIETLDHLKHELRSDMLVIADAERPVAIAGVMGGANSEVGPETTAIVLESANFHPAQVRRCASALSIRTESSMRFEKGLDPLQTDLAIRRFVTLLQEMCPGVQICTPLLDVDRYPRQNCVIHTSCDFIRQRLGTPLEDELIVDILTRLAFQVEQTNDGLSVTVPSFRSTGDVSIPEDLVEEVGRIYGFDNIAPVAPFVPVEPVQVSPLHRLQRQLRQVLSHDLGFHEVFNYAFVGDKQLEALQLEPAAHIGLRNPLASDQNRLRTSLVPNMLKITAENLRFRKHFCLYELERIFDNSPRNDAFEHDRFALCGLIAQQAWKSGPPECFYTIKGALEGLLEQLPVAGERHFRPVQGHLPAWCHPGRSAEVWIGNTLIGMVSQLHPQIAQELGIKAGVGLFDLDVSALLQLPEADAHFVRVQKYPTVPFDISLICPERTLIADVAQVIRHLDERIRKVELFDVYVGDKLGAGNKSLAFTVTFAAPDHTLQPAEIEDLQNRVMQALESNGYQVRKG